MTGTFQFLAAFATALFAGAAVYVNIAEHPARMTLSPGNAVAQWAPSYARATLMQAPLAIIGCLAGIGAWVSGGGAIWLYAAIVIGAVVPYTFIVIMPTNRALLAPARGRSNEKTRELLQRWTLLHAARSAAGVAAAVLMLIDLARR